MTKAIVKQEQSMTAMKTSNMKAIVDGLIYGHPDMEFNVAIDEDTVVPLQCALVTADKKHIILASPETARKLVESGKGKMVFRAMTEEEKVKQLGA